MVSEQKLADGNFICRKVCSKKTFKIFDKVHATLGDVTAHIEQVEKGTRIWNELLLPLKKAKDKTQKLKCLGAGGPLLYVSPSTGLVALVETNYKFIVFGKTQRLVSTVWQIWCSMTMKKRRSRVPMARWKRRSSVL